jgi:AraC-like DNA-binding protein
MNELWQAFVQITASVNALLLGSVLILSPRLHRTRSRQKLGFALLGYGYLLLSFTAKDNLWLPLNWWLLLSDYVIVLLSAALFMDYMTGSLGRRKLPRVYYLPPLAFAGVSLIAGREFVFGPAINIVVILQFAYTCLTTWVFVRSGRGLASRPRHHLVLLSGIWVLHVFQFGRMLLPDIGWLFDTVPLVGAAIFLAFTVLVLTDSRALRTLSELDVAADVSEDRTRAIEGYMLAERPHLDPRLKLEQLANAIGMPSRDLSRVIGSSPDGSFYTFVNRFRVAEARELLTSSAETRTSVEAIGLMAGFRSRSTFYEAFKRDTGLTPAQFRKQGAGSGAVSG